MNEQRHEWPASQPAAADASPLLPLAFKEQVELVKSSAAVDALARRRAGQMVSHGHTPESDLTKPIGQMAGEVRWRMDALIDIVGRRRMNLPRGRRGECLRRIESAGAVLIALWERVQVEVAEE